MNLLTRSILLAGITGAAIYGISKLVEEINENGGLDLDDLGDLAGLDSNEDIFTMSGESDTIPHARSYARA